MFYKLPSGELINLQLVSFISSFNISGYGIMFENLHAKPKMIVFNNENSRDIAYTKLMEFIKKRIGLVV